MFAGRFSFGCQPLKLRVMITRFYVDNYKCLVNFEYKPKPFELIIGANGSGKTTVFEALNALRDFIVNDVTASEAFLGKTLARWQSRDAQRFELEIFDAETGGFSYLLELKYNALLEEFQVHEEALKKDGHLVIGYERISEVDDSEEGSHLSARIWVGENIELEDMTWSVVNRSVLSSFSKKDAPSTFVF